MYMLHNVSIRAGKRILLNLLIFLCLFSQSALITNAQINSNPQGSFEVEIGGSVGSTSATPVTTTTVSVSISGFASPNASIVLLDSSNNSITTITAGPLGDFTITGLLLPAGSAQYCFRVVDFKRLGTSESCMTINPTTLSTITNVYLPPTIGVEKAEISEGQEAVIYGYTMPNAKVKLRLSTGEIVNITADENGYYEYRNDALKAGDYSFVASASYNATDSLESKTTAKLKALSPEEVILKAKEAIKNVGTTEDGGFPWWIFIVLFLLALGAGLFFLYKTHPELFTKLWLLIAPFITKLGKKKSGHHEKLLKQLEKETKDNQKHSKPTATQA